MKLPFDARASCQYSEAAIGSPSIGKRMVFTGTPDGKRRIASRKCFKRSLPDTLLPRGGFSP